MFMRNSPATTSNPEPRGRKRVALLAILFGCAAVSIASPASAFVTFGSGAGHGFGSTTGPAHTNPGHGYYPARPSGPSGWRGPISWPRRAPPVYAPYPRYIEEPVYEGLSVQRISPPVRRRVVQKAPKPAAAVAPRPPKKTPPARPLVPTDPQVAPGEILCEIGNGFSLADVDRIAQTYHLARRSVQPIGLTRSMLYRFSVTDGQPVDAVIARLKTDARFASAQPNMVFRLQDGDTKALTSAQYAPAKLHLQQVHSVARGEGILVAMLDSGVDPAHPELAGSIVASLNALSSEPTSESHGTAVASVIAAHASLTGMAPDAKILAVRAFSATPSDVATGTTADVVRAISLAVETGARVVNMSFAGPADPLLARVIAAASDRGVVFVAAGGNAGPTAPPAYPAADPHVIAVTATDARDALLPAANHGAYIGVAAPGVDILVATPGAGYALNSGTSIAAAYVSGLVALMMQHDSKLTPQDARRLLTDSARDLGPAGADPAFGAGLIDPERAVDAARRASAASTIVPSTIAAASAK